MATRPCPCGWLGAADATKPCRCTPDQVARYQGRISGPLLDRIDLQVEVAAVKPQALLTPEPNGERSADLAARVARARERQLSRQSALNADLAAAELDAHCVLDAATRHLAEQAARQLGWSGRSLHRTLKVARTIADLDGSATIGVAHLAEAMQLRRGLPGA